MLEAMRVRWMCCSRQCTTGRPSYHPSVLLKLYIYGSLNLNQVQSRRRIDREAGRRPATCPRHCWKPLHQTATSTSRVCRQKHRSPEPDCPQRSSPPGTPEAACLARDRSPQRSASSDPSATAESHCGVNHIQRVFTHGVIPGSSHTEALGILRVL